MRIFPHIAGLFDGCGIKRGALRFAPVTHIGPRDAGPLSVPLCCAPASSQAVGCCRIEDIELQQGANKSSIEISSMSGPVVIFP